MRSTFLTIPLLFLIFSCEDDKVPAPIPPSIDKAIVTCKDDSNQDYKLVEKITVEILDADRDLVVDSFIASVNGMPMTLTDGAAVDDIFEWTPPTILDPPMICKGDFRISVQASDATKLVTKKRFVVTK